LGDQELDILISGLEVAFYRKGKIIFKKGESRKYIYIVFSGLIHLSEDDQPVDYISRGEPFGIMTLGTAYPFMLTARAVEDTICYLVQLEKFDEVFRNNKRFSSFFMTLIGRRFRHFRSIASEKKILEESAIALEVKRIIYRRPVMSKPDESVGSAAVEMDRRGVSSIIAVDETSKPVGILTHKDLRDVVIRGNRLDPISKFMSYPVISVDSKASVFEAFTKMVEAGVDHLVVLENQALLGVITRKDIQIHLEPSLSIFSLYRRAVDGRSIRNLKVILSNTRTSISKLALSGVDFFDMSRMISSIYDVITAKAIEIVTADHSSPDFVWVHMGSSGRKEEIIATDQDNAIIHGGGLAPGLAVEICQTFEELGIPKCPGNFMASNDKWNQSISTWQAYFGQWFSEHLPDHIRNLTIFLDMRPVYGNAEFFVRLRETMKGGVTKEVIKLLAADAIEIEPPVGILAIRGFSKIDIKTFALYPLVNGVRVLAVDAGLLDITNTGERLEALDREGTLSHSMCHDLRESYGFLQDLRLRRHARAVLQGSRADNRLDVRELSKMDLLVLKECFKVIRSFQKIIMSRFDVSKPASVREL